MKSRIRFPDVLEGKNFHTSLITTFGIDFDAYEEVALPRLRGAGCRNNLLLTDAGMLTYALSGASATPLFAGKNYTVTGIEAGGVFHPKVTLLIGREAARLVVSSANMTAPGLGSNTELAGTIEATPDHGGEAKLVASALKYVQLRLAGRSDAVRHQLDWLARRSGWLNVEDEHAGLVTLADGTSAAFLASEAGQGIGERFLDLVQGEQCERLIVISPYWDDDLGALKGLIERLNPVQVVLLVDVKAALFPAHALPRGTGVQIIDIGDSATKSFVHAKAFIVQTRDADHLLYGSANCTEPALGNFFSGTVGSNEEACLYRRLPPGQAVEAMELSDILVEDILVSVGGLPALRKAEELKLKSLVSRSPGAFELSGEVLTWRPTKFAAESATDFELLDFDEAILPSKLKARNERSGNQQTYLLEGIAPTFIRLKFWDGTSSGLAIVTLTDEILKNVRELRGQKVENAARVLAEGVEVDLYVLDALQDLILAESSEANRAPGAKHAKKDLDNPEAVSNSHETLDYAAFVAGARTESRSSGVRHSSFEGSNLSLVQSCLNRIIGVESEAAESTTALSEKIKASFDRGDETANPQGDLNAGTNFGSNLDGILSQEELRKMRHKKAEAESKYAHRLRDALDTQLKRLWTLRGDGLVLPVDALRLRAVLMVIAATASDLNSLQLSKRRGDIAQLTSIRVLPGEGDGCWPATVMAYMKVFFATDGACIEHLRLPAAVTGVPADIIECWATCAWAMIVSRLRAERDALQTSGSQRNSGWLAIHYKVYERVGLSVDDFRGRVFERTFEALANGCSTVLGVSPQDVLRVHHETLSEMEVAATTYSRSA